MTDPNIHVTQNVGEVKPGGTVIGVQVTYQGEPVLIPSPEDIQLHRAELAKLPNYSRWADEFYIHEEGKILPLFASPYEEVSGRRREDLLQTIRSHQRLLVLGEPGMGKTVAMERMVWETAKSDELVVPILVSLSNFQGELIELIRVALNETRILTFDTTKSVRAFLHKAKSLILFDGLNETPGNRRKQVVGAIADFMREYSKHRYVVTSRSQDELWRKLWELIHDAVVVQNISDLQAQEYLQAHLGKEKGQALYDRLDTSLKELARIPLLLWLIKEAGQGTDQLPRNRGELFDKFVMNKLLERDRKLELELNEKPEVKKKALAHLAFALQLDHQLSCDREWAEKALVRKGFEARSETILNEALLHGLLFQQNLPDRQLLRFMHQSVQEYFVALTLLREVRSEKNANRLQNAARQLSRRNLRYWAKDSWWNECFVQLAGLVQDADWLARRIVKASPWLAWWCVEEGREVQEATRDLIETRSIRLLQSDRVTDRRRAVQTLARIKNERAMEPLLLAAGDKNREVSNLAVQALVEMGEAARLAIRKAWQGENSHVWRGSFRYVVTQSDELLKAEIPFRIWEEFLGQSMVWVPAGEFLEGSGNGRYHRSLPGYWIGRYPVTVAQWRLYVQESGYKTDERSLRDPDNHPVRYVNWDDAMAYCKWLGKKSGLPVTLPSEEEWEKAARGTDGRIYPWGDEFDKNKCNTRESGIGNTTPVGRYSPAGDSPYGCADMSGNVWEWTRSKYMPYRYNSEDLGGRDYWVLRGGSWFFDLDFARASFSDSLYPSGRHNYFGFRLVVRPPSL